MKLSLTHDMLSRRDSISAAVLLAAWVGIWWAWIPDSTAALSQHALYLAEWATFLPAVRSGQMRVVPEMVRLAVALAAVALAWGAGGVRRGWVRGLLILIALIPVGVMLPPYPDLTQLWWSPSYGLRFTMASIGLVGIAASLLSLWLPPTVRCALIVGCAAGAAAVGIGAYVTLRPYFEGYYLHRLAPGRGMLLFVGGLAAAMVLQASLLAGLGRQTERGPTTKA